MKRLQKKRIIIGVIILLLLINISAISTIVLHKYRVNKFHNNQKEQNYNKKEKKSSHQRVKTLIKEELNLTDEQFINYCELKDQNINKSKLLFSQISDNRKLIINEVKKETPDTILLRNLAENIGILHTQIQIETVKHFLNVKKTLNKEQLKKFDLLLSKMNNRKKHRRQKKYRHRNNRIK